MNPLPVWTEEVLIRSFETDFRERWKPACFFQTIQETATHHANHLGYDYHAMMERSTIWILSRVKISFRSFPVLGDKVQVRTWPKGIQQRLFFMRDFHFDGAGGQRLADATSAWVLIDPAARKLIPPRAFEGHLPHNEGLHALDEPLEKLAVPEDLPEQFQRAAGYSAVDLMGHVNNARYIEWISDTLLMEEYERGTLRWLQINYLNEVKPGERVSVRAGRLPGGGGEWLVQGLNLETGTRAFEAAMELG